MGLPSDLVRGLRDAYTQAPQRYVAVRVHLFGKVNADRLEGVPLKPLCEAAGIPETWATEIHKGIRLAEFVTPK